MKPYRSRTGSVPRPRRAHPYPVVFAPTSGPSPSGRSVLPSPISPPRLAGLLAVLGYLLIGFLLPAPAAAQTGPATLRGWVLRAGTDAPLAAARVELLGTRKVAITDSAGRFQVDGLPPGVVVVRVRYLGLGDQRWKVPLRAGTSTSIVFRVSLGVIPVPAVHVTVKRVIWPQMRGFEYRMKHDDGVFITRDEIARRQPQKISDLMRTVPGITFAPPTTEFGDTRVLMGHGRLQCTPTLYLDGHRVTAFRLDDFIPEHIEAIEVYTRMSTVPGQFRIGPARCGAILLWSRNTF